MPRGALSSLIVLVLACSMRSSDGRPDASRPIDARPLPDVAAVTDRPVPRLDAPTCETPPMPAGIEVALAPEFADLYTAYALGPVPGVPMPLGGMVAKPGDPSRLLVAGASERYEGGIYEIEVRRDTCGHVLGFVGSAVRVASTPYVDANLVFGEEGVLVYTGWPMFLLSQLSPGAAMPARETDLRGFGIADFPDEGPGGVGFVPPGLAASEELRIVTWPDGHWYHVNTTFSGGLYTVESLTEATTLPNNPGGFAYVPAGSPGFPTQSLIVAEWRRGDPASDRVAVYEVDVEGDPIPSTRREFFTRFPRPWGAYFEPVTGDYMFLTWGHSVDSVYLVQGFVPPPILF